MDSYTWHPASNGFLYPSLTLLIMETILELTQIGLFGLCHPREKYFIWFTTHNGLLTTHKLHTINNITQSPHCPLCLNHPEDQDHIYSKACNVKNLKIYGIALMLILLFFFFWKPLHLWIGENCRSNTVLSISTIWGTIFIYVCLRIFGCLEINLSFRKFLSPPLLLKEMLFSVQ